MRTNTFFVSGDDWGLVEITPAENREQYAQVARQHAAHHQDTVFSLSGWTTPPFIIPAPQISIAARRIALKDLEMMFADALQCADVMQTCEDTTGEAYDCRDSFAFYVGQPRDNCGLYGTLEDGCVDSLYLSERLVDEKNMKAVTRALVALGRQYELILVSHGSEVVSLTDEQTVLNYLRDEEEA